MIGGIDLGIHNKQPKVIAAAFYALISYGDGKAAAGAAIQLFTLMCKCA